MFMWSFLSIVAPGCLRTCGAFSVKVGMISSEDHPLEYASFAGEIPAGEYGGGKVMIWDSGTYDCEKWSDDEVKVILHGRRATGRYVLFRTGGKNWLIHRMDPAPEGWEPMPEAIQPMLATRGKLPPPSEDAAFGYEMAWDGVRAIVYVEGGEARVTAADGGDVSATYPELRGLGEVTGSIGVVLDGVIVAVDSATKRISAEPLLPRLRVKGAARIRRLAEQVPATYLAFDVLYLDGHNTLGLAYQQRRELLDSLALRGAHWDTPPGVRELGGRAAMELARQQGLGGVVAKRLDSMYQPGRRSRSWIEVKT